MKETRNFLKVPGQKLVITLAANDARDINHFMIHVLNSLKDDHGLALSVVSGSPEVLTITARTPQQSQQAYIESLEPSQRECLRGHLDALGFEL